MFNRNKKSLPEEITEDKLEYYLSKEDIKAISPSPEDAKKFAEELLANLNKNVTKCRYYDSEFYEKLVRIDIENDRAFTKRYGESKEYELTHGTDLVAQVTMGNHQITREEYEKGKDALEPWVAK